LLAGWPPVIHGSPTTTFHLHTLVKVTRDNAKRLSKALTQLEARFREHSAVIRPAVEDILAGGHLFLMTRAGPLDVLGFIGENLRYEDLLDASSEVWMNIGSLRVLGLEALIAEKKRMGRAKDNAAVELLEEVLRHRLQRD
jgi:hypothetical protein